MKLLNKKQNLYWHFVFDIKYIGKYGLFKSIELQNDPTR
jgi:hypothetical protein